MEFCDIFLRNDSYFSAFSSSLGGTCFHLEYKKDVSVLRGVQSIKDYYINPYICGNPLLFPPNRIKDGTFEFNNRKYCFPINDKLTNCHLHGMLYNRAFKIIEHTFNKVTFLYRANSNEYMGFPHAFEICRQYILGNDGLTENTSCKNLSSEIMPFMLAYHTTFNVSICKPGERRYLKTNIDYEILRDQHYLPTGQYAYNSNKIDELRSGRYLLGEANYSAFYKSSGTKVEIINFDKGYNVVYETDRRFGYKMLYEVKEKGFVSIEPQTCSIDCFHLQGSPDSYGMILLMPKEKIILSTKIYVVDNQ